MHCVMDSKIAPDDLTDLQQELERPLDHKSAENTYLRAMKLPKYMVGKVSRSTMPRQRSSIAQYPPETSLSLLNSQIAFLPRSGSECAVGYPRHLPWLLKQKFARLRCLPWL